MRALSAMMTGSHWLEANGLAPASSINLEDSGLPKVCLKAKQWRACLFKLPCSSHCKFRIRSSKRFSKTKNSWQCPKPSSMACDEELLFKESRSTSRSLGSVPPVGGQLCGQDVGGTTFGCTRYLLSICCRKLTRANYTYPLDTTLTLGPQLHDWNTRLVIFLHVNSSIYQGSCALECQLLWSRGSAMGYQTVVKAEECRAQCWNQHV